MSKSLPADVRRLVAERAGFRCEYCLIPESQTFIPHQIDHIIAQKHGGSATLDNLAFSCAICNKRKGTDVATIDPINGQITPLFNPRHDKWSEHFQLDEARIKPLSAIGRATIQLLQLNRPQLLIERELLLRIGLLQTGE